MISDLMWFVAAGFCGGALGGYLGLGGGILIVPFLTIVVGLPIKDAVPVSISAVVMNSIAASNEYLKKGMVDFELTVTLALFMVIGSIIGSSLSSVIPDIIVRTLFSVLLVYSAVSFLISRNSDRRMSFTDNRTRHLFFAASIILFVGILAGLLGVGGGVVLVPLMYLVIGLPLTSARGTSSFLIGFSSAAAMTVYLLRDSVDLQVVPAVLLGAILGGKTGGLLGTLAKPLAVKIIFFVVMLFLAFKLALEPLL